VDGEQDYILAEMVQPVRNLGVNASGGVPEVVSGEQTV